jgi:hypothetical protein
MSRLLLGCYEGGWEMNMQVKKSVKGNPAGLSWHSLLCPALSYIYFSYLCYLKVLYH